MKSKIMTLCLCSIFFCGAVFATPGQITVVNKSRAYVQVMNGNGGLSSKLAPKSIEKLISGISSMHLNDKNLYTRTWQTTSDITIVFCGGQSGSCPMVGCKLHGVSQGTVIVYGPTSLSTTPGLECGDGQ